MPVMRKLFTALLFSFALPLLIQAQDASSLIRLNQVGFYPDSKKIAVIADNTDGEFIVTNVTNNGVVYKGKLSGPKKSSYSPNITRIADFSAVKTQGIYKINVPGKGDSYTFEVKPKVFNSLTKALIKGFYFQRMSTHLYPEYSGKWSRADGHPDKEVIVHPAAASASRPAGSIVSCPGGWYDAGDYNKYIVNSGITMGTLLSFPESGDKVPDLLNEILWNLRWMFTMQDPADGGVYNKVTNADFDGMVMPSQCITPRYLIPKGTAATLDFAAVMAQSGRIFAKFKTILPGLSDSCMSSAIKAWGWAVINPKVEYDQNKMNNEFKPVINTGGYGDNNFSDEFIWAASELYVSTKKTDYYKAINMVPDTLMPLPSWNQVKLLGYYSLARYQKKLKGNAKKDFKVIKSGLIREADKMIAGASERSYQTAMGNSVRDFVWGSNSVAANQGILLIQVYKLTSDRKYLDYALSNLDYIMGRNATGYSFVTGVGHKTPMHIHHRQSEADFIDDPVPGLLAGGPNPGQQDKCTTYTSKIADESYTDVSCSYASNEIAINWNAPAAYLAGAIEALMNH